MENKKQTLINLSASEIPADVKSAQVSAKAKSSLEREEHIPHVYVFFSFDIVNSTIYKENVSNWPTIIQNLLNYLQKSVFNEPDLQTSELWRIIGDEMVFAMIVPSKQALFGIVDAIFRVLQQGTLSIKNGRFFESLEDQAIQKAEIDMLKSQGILAIKATAWLAVINTRLSTPYDNIRTDYPMPVGGNYIREYLGKDMDTGFRLKGKTQDRRLTLSFELAYALLPMSQEIPYSLNIIDYVQLKGVWNDSLYPLIWYYNEAEVEKDQQGESIKFDQSFRYDEAQNNEVVAHYKERSKAKSGTSTLDDDMYDFVKASRKIISDKNLSKKVAYIESIISSETKQKIKDENPSRNEPLELHCAVVCCDVEKREILIMRRGADHRRNKGKWEFGCAKAKSDATLTDTIQAYYRETFGIDIELVLDPEREEKQPIPLAVYELPGMYPSTKRKGIIFVAKVIEPSKIENYRSNAKHSEVNWVSAEDCGSINKDDAIQDLNATMKKVFAHFDEYFGKDSNYR